MSTGLKANSDGSAAIQVGGTDVITLTSGGAATFVTSPTTVQAGTAAAPSITFSGDTNTGIYSPGADTIAFTEGGAEVARFDSSGNFGLATSSPFSTSGAAVLTVGGSSSSKSGRLFLRDASNNNQIQVYISSTFNEFNSQSELNVRTEAGALRFTTANTERARFNDTGAFVLAGGTTTANGIGITFPATQSASSNANTLDDYEEGDWTPSLGGTATYTSRYGKYTKIGNVVTCQFRIQVNAIGTGSTDTLSGFPFTSANLGDVQSGGCSFFSGLAVNTSWLSCYIQNNATSALFVGQNAFDGTVTNAPGLFGNGADVYGSITYRVA